MDHMVCNVVFVHRAATEYDSLDVKEVESSLALVQDSTCAPSLISRSQSKSVDENLEQLLRISSQGMLAARSLDKKIETKLQDMIDNTNVMLVHVCSCAKSCMAKLSELNKTSMVDLVPTIVLIHVPDDEPSHVMSRCEMRSSHFSSTFELRQTRENDESVHSNPQIDDEYGLELIERISLDIQYQSLSSLIVPVALIDVPNSAIDEMRSVSKSATERTDQSNRLFPSLNQARTMRCLDAGAVDVLVNPIREENLSCLLIHVYRAHKDALKKHTATLMEMSRTRKRSWVGVDDQKPYAYLREAMVSGLMDGICQLEDHDPPTSILRLVLSPDRKQTIVAALGSWNFSAHEFTDDELLHAALLMLQHTLSMPELETWRISTENLIAFLLASRSAYNAFVPYHNFRHVIDVLQACFIFLIHLGKIPPFADQIITISSYSSVLADSIRPIDALTLLITAIGHDVGHPGVNNAFLITLNAPLAQLFNDRSVLESFHCAAYSQILRRNWSKIFQTVEIRKLMISTILATDMGLHFDYMKRLARVPDKLPSNSLISDSKSWSVEEQRTLACSLLIKCADISNVARKYEVASQWTMILTDEFSRQAVMEKELGIPSALFSAPVREIFELGKSQIDFMETFALPLFQGVAEVMPAMAFCVEELHRNKSIWQEKITQDQRFSKDIGDLCRMDGTISFHPAQMENSSISNLKSSNDENKPRSEKTLSPRPTILHLSPKNFDNLSSPSEISPLQNSIISDPRHISSTKPSSICLVCCYQDQDLAKQTPTPKISNQDDLSSETIEDQTESFLFSGECLTARKTSVTFNEIEKGRRSDETEGSSSSVAGDWTSQATSDNIPRSPSTPGSSVALELENENENSDTHTQQNSIIIPVFEKWHDTQPCNDNTNREENTDICEKNLSVVQKVRVLQKKPSRFRMNFWKRGKKDSLSPILFHDADHADDADAEGWGCGLGGTEIATKALMKEKRRRKKASYSNHDECYGTS